MARNFKLQPIPGYQFSGRGYAGRMGFNYAAMALPSLSNDGLNELEALARQARLRKATNSLTQPTRRPSPRNTIRPKFGVADALYLATMAAGMVVGTVLGLQIFGI